MPEPTLPVITSRQQRPIRQRPNRQQTTVISIPRQPNSTSRHARYQARRQRLINLGLFLYSFALIAGLVIAAFS